MKAWVTTCCILALGACTSTGWPVAFAGPQDLLGAWRVDLRPTPASPPYFQDFVVSSVQGKTFTGTFYGAPIEQARMNAEWGALRIAFITSDGSGPYHHSAVLSGGLIDGLTHSTGRDFLAYWSASRP